MSLGASIPEPPTLSFQHLLLPPGTWQSPWIPKVTPPSTSHTESRKSKTPTKCGLYPRSVSMLKVFREWQRQTNETVKTPQWGFSKAGTERPRSSEHFHTNCCWSVEVPSCSASEPEATQHTELLLSRLCRALCETWGMCEENTQIPLLRQHPVYVCGGEGRGVRVLIKLVN